MDASDLHPDLARLAQAHGVATEFWDWQGQHVTVPNVTLTSVLRALGVPAVTDDDIKQSLADLDDRPWRRVLPPVVVARAGAHDVTVRVHAPAGVPVRAGLRYEGRAEVSTDLDLVSPSAKPETRSVAGVEVAELAYKLPADTPLGYHDIVVVADGDGQPLEASAPLIVVPNALPTVDLLQGRRQWGPMVQLYQLRSEASWGHGDLADLRELAVWSARAHGAGFVLVNPLHAPDPTAPLENSPYLPSSRRFVAPIYIRVEDIRETAYLSAADRAIIEWQAEELRARNRQADLLDRDSVWKAKLAALERVYAVPRSPSRQDDFERFCVREGEGLLDWATWCALRELYGEPPVRWPSHAGRPDMPAVADLREELSERLLFHCWLQWVADEQLAAVQRTAKESGMALGVVHELAVGVHPDGAEAWALQDVLAQGVTVGAPPDAFNQQGQDWSQPPWRPDALAEVGYRPFRDMLRSILRHSSGIRIDHVMGLFRLWWIPEETGPDEGTYVRYDHEALVGILALEATRAGAVVIGEDLGNVEPWVRDHLRERGVLGTSILWFEKDEDDQPRRPQTWRDLCLATVATHDLPPAMGYLAGEHLDVRERLGLLTRPAEEERAQDHADKRAFLRMLDELGLLPPEPTDDQVVEALHRLLTWTPARLVGVAVSDLVGDLRAVNQPGTNDEYPNWRVPLTDTSGTPVLIEDLVRNAHAAHLARVVSEGI